MKNKIFSIIFLFLFTLIFADTTKIDPDQYIVKIGDVFFIQTVNDTMSFKSPVLPAGVLSLFPFADSVSVAGKTLTETYAEIDRKIGNNISRDMVMIQLGTISPIRFHLMGAVVRPGEYTSPTLITLQEALTKSGGVASSSSKKIKILRNNELLEFDLNQYYAHNDITANPLIMHDDVIMVNLAEKFVKVYTNNDTINFIESIEIVDNKSKISDVMTQLSRKHKWSKLDMFTVDRQGKFLTVDIDFELEHYDSLFIPVEELYVYITGFVVRQGRYPYNGNMNAIYYLSQSGGPNTNGSKDKLYIIRKHGEPELYTGQEIRPGDTLYVPESLRSMIVSYLGPFSTFVSVISTMVLIYININ